MPGFPDLTRHRRGESRRPIFIAEKEHCCTPCRSEAFCRPSLKRPVEGDITTVLPEPATSDSGLYPGRKWCSLVPLSHRACMMW